MILSRATEYLSCWLGAEHCPGEMFCKTIIIAVIMNRQLLKKPNEYFVLVASYEK